VTITPRYSEFIMAMERLQRRLRLVAQALEQAGIPYAVIGGNAVAAWVARVDPAATRTTKDVDLLVNRSDLDGITRAFEAIGFGREDLRSITLFVDPEEPSRRSGVHLVWAGELVRPSYSHPAPNLDETVADDAGFRVLDLPALVRMKLTSLRSIDRVHIEDLISSGLIDDAIRAALPQDLGARLDQIEADLDDEP
jgi:hypothetical protein